MAKDIRTQPTSPNSIPTSQPAGFFKKKGCRPPPPEPAAAARQPFFLKNPAGWDVGMEFGDVGCVRISFAINSNPFPAHSHCEPIKSYWSKQPPSKRIFSPRIGGGQPKSDLVSPINEQHPYTLCSNKRFVIVHCCLYTYTYGIKVLSARL